MPAASNQHTWVALIGLDDTELPQLDQVLTHFGPSSEQALDVADGRVSGHVVTWTWEGRTAAYTLVNRPIAASALVGPCATAWYWPDASEAIRKHTAHLIITLVDQDQDRVSCSMRLTRLVAAVSKAAAPAAVAVLWGPSGTIHEPAAFLDQAQQMSRDDLPLFLWIDFRIEPVDEGLVRLFTTGLHRLGHREIEVPPIAMDTQELLNAAYNVAHFVLASPGKLGDGDTLGLPDGAQASLRLAHSLLDDRVEAMRIEFT